MPNAPARKPAAQEPLHLPLYRRPIVTSNRARSSCSAENTNLLIFPGRDWRQPSTTSFNRQMMTMFLGAIVFNLLIVLVYSGVL